MDSIYSVAVSYGENNGWIEFDPNAKTVKVFLDDEKAVKDAVEFLTKSHDIMLPCSNVMDFVPANIDPLSSVRNFQIALSRLWEATKVHVDWSRPVEYVKEHPYLD